MVILQLHLKIIGSENIMSKNEIILELCRLLDKLKKYSKSVDCQEHMEVLIMNEAEKYLLEILRQLNKKKRK